MLTHFLLCILEKKNLFFKKKQLRFSRMLDLFKDKKNNMNYINLNFVLLKKFNLNLNA